MSKSKPPLSDEALEWFRRQGQKGGKAGGEKGGKASLVTMTKAERKARARKASAASVAAKQARALQRAKQVAKLQAAGTPMPQIAAELGVSINTVYRLARLARGRRA